MSQSSFESLAVIITAGQPSVALASLVQTLSGASFAAIVVVDDGAGLAEFPRAHMVRHAVALGKGGALRSGIHLALASFPNLTGVVATEANSDAADILRLADTLLAQPKSFVAGTSQAIPAALAREALKIESNGPEFDRKLLALARRQGMAPLRTIPSGLFAAIVGLILAAGLALEIRGLFTENLFLNDIWVPDGWKRFLHFIALFVLITIPLMVLVPWSYTGLVVGMATLGTLFASGPLALLAVLVFAVSACALGSRILARADDTSLTDQTLATVLGTAVYIFVMTLLARQAVNYPPVWIILLALPVAWDWSGVRRRLTAFLNGIRRAELCSWSERGAAALLIFVLAMHWLIALKPEISADGLAMHLAIPVNIAAQHRMTFDPSRFIWSVMPMGADWIYAIVYQLGGEAASRLVDFAMLLAVVALVYAAARRWLNNAPALLLAALFATTPMVQLLTGSLFVENVLAALILALLTAIWRLGDTGSGRYLYAAAILAGGALATKFGAVAFVALALPFAVTEAIRHWRRLSMHPALTCAFALLIFAATAAPTYAIAYQKTHNPFYPFLNSKFPSPYLDRTVPDNIDPRYHDPVAPRLLYDLTFSTGNFYEARNGSFGFQYLLLTPLILAGLLVFRNRTAVSATVIGLVTAIVILKSNSNARYIYPALPIVTVAFAALMGWTASHSRTLFRALVFCGIAWIALNTYFMPASGWYHRDFYSPFTFSKHGETRYLANASPERLVIRRFNQLHPGAALLLTADTNIADVKGEVFENSWHQWNNAIAIQHTSTLADMSGLFDKWDVKYFVSPTRATGVKLMPPWLRDFLDLCTVTEYELGGYELSRTASGCKDPNTPTLPGTSVDDFDDAVKYTGPWEHNHAFGGPYRHTVSFTDAKGADVQFAFNGTAITYVFTRTFNRGIAHVQIDGRDEGTIDLYSPDTEWQVTRKFSLPPGPHVIQIRVTGNKSPRSSGTFVDVDQFVVE